MIYEGGLQELANLAKLEIEDIKKVKENLAAKATENEK